MFIPTKAQIEEVSSSPYFDAEWYSNTYPDVVQSGLLPVEHYLRFGRILERDPSPLMDGGFYIDSKNLPKTINPILDQSRTKGSGPYRPMKSRILHAASNLGRRKGWDYAIDVSEGLLQSSDLKHSLSVLKANAALARGDSENWLQAFNDYLQYWDAVPLTLCGKASNLFKQLRPEIREPVFGGPKLSVLMPAWNAEDTIEMAVNSILRQSWQNLELIVIDDCSTDKTWKILQRLRKTDDRLKVRRNSTNVGPYVSKNIALESASGEWITGHDADDVALPDRLTQQMSYATSKHYFPASLSYMVRLSPTGEFSHLGVVGSFSPDGVARIASISCLFKTEFLRNRLGYWDSVRFGADSEMIARAKRAAGKDFGYAPVISMLCLDLETSLTNHAEFGVKKKGGLSPVRVAYRESWRKWHEHEGDTNLRLPFPQEERKYFAPSEMVVPVNNVNAARESAG